MTNEVIIDQMDVTSNDDDVVSFSSLDFILEVVVLEVVVDVSVEEEEEEDVAFVAVVGTCSVVEASSFFSSATIFVASANAAASLAV